MHGVVCIAGIFAIASGIAPCKNLPQTEDSQRFPPSRVLLSDGASTLLMNGFADHGLDESAFGDKGGFTEGLRTFDAFRKSV